ncbi:MAG: SDR family NAD(P)-dependent oxidoreductase [Deltaproteobacteria bacterium]|nr:MAG: SDR family NAD(P)-dependent oxidoreductase [Deltaproteobacteria bacterium]
MGEPRSVLIAGCGYVGARLGTLLAARGDVAIGLRRNPGTLPDGITAVKADLCAPASLDAIPTGITDVVITTAPGGGDDERYRQAYVEGPQNLLSFLRGRGDPVKRVLLTTSTGVYAQTGGDWVDERSPTEPTHFSGKRMLEGEAVIAAGEFESVAVRLAGIYGPGRTRLIDRVKSGEARTPRQSLWTNRIHRDDCAGLLEALLDLDAPPRVVIGVDQEPAELDDVQRFLAAELSVAVPPAQEPPKLEQTAEGSKKESQGRRPRSNKRCSNALALALGYRFRFPTYREGYRAMLAAEGHGR